MTHHPDTDQTSFGLWVYLMSDCVLFASLFATYAVLQGGTANASTGAELFNRSFVLTETLLLLTSSFTCGLAILSARKKKISVVWTMLGATFLLGAAFLAMELHEFSNLVAAGNGWSASAFLSSFFTLVGTHGLHVLLGLIWLLVLLLHLGLRGITEKTEKSIVHFSLFWHFLDIVWICVFSLVYLLGSLPA